MNDLIQAVRQNAHRGQGHVFLGHPLSDGCDKTTVEPGNVYSPGVWTCGVAVWVEIGGQFVSPESLPAETVSWTFVPPVLISTWPVGNGVAVEHRLVHLGGEGSEGADFAEVRVSGSTPSSVRVHVVVRDIGPAGGKIAKMAWVDGTLLINESLRLTPETPPASRQVCPAGDGADSPVGILSFDVTAGSVVRFRTEHGFGGRAFTGNLPLERPHAGVGVTEAFAAAQRGWEAELPARVFAPDPRIAATWERCAYHILAAMECGLPRIGAVNYPVFWIRDGVIVLRSLDLMGRRDLARRGNEYLATQYFGGGFGGESDAPGEGIWCLTSHARMTGDRAWLAEIFPHLKTRVEWLLKMRRATRPLRMACENRIPFYQHTPGVNILCLPARDGVIRGRMDWHSPEFFINCWAVAGLRRAAEAAVSLGEEGMAAAWRGEADDLEAAVARVLLPEYGNPRDAIITPYPSGTLGGHPQMREAFTKWYRANRLRPDGTRSAEPEWTYFEAAQIHNAMILGLQREAWTNLDGMLNDRMSPTWDVTAYIEGPPNGNEFLPFRNGEGSRGWLAEGCAVAGNMPHNWTNAEMVALLRDLFVREDQNGLVLGLGVPAGWLAPGSRFGVRAMPTEQGMVTYTVEVGGDGKWTLEYDGPKEYRVAFAGMA